MADRDRQRLPETADQQIGPVDASRTQKSPNFAMIIGIPLLLLVLVGGSILLYTNGIFPFSKKSSGGISNTSNTSNSSGSTGAIVNGRGCTKIGVLLPEAWSARWENKDHPLLVAAITNVIAYDRLIYSSDTNSYVSFDGVAVGKLQGDYIAAHYQSYVTANSTPNTVVINGAKEDNNALLFSKGAHQALDPLFSGGVLKNIYEKFTRGWNNATAQAEMQAALLANSNTIAIAYVANDSMANSVIAALKAVNLSGKVLVTGQDATVAGIQNILKGDQAMTVYKAFTKEASATAQVIAALSAGTGITSLTSGATTQIPLSGYGSIPSILETPVVVDKTNIQSTVIADNFVTVSDICVGLPSGTGGICP